MATNIVWNQIGYILDNRVNDYKIYTSPLDIDGKNEVVKLTPGQPQENCGKFDTIQEAKDYVQKIWDESNGN